ncbi:MAG: hypothetical protein WBN56_04990 [Robiginitalea sp.]|uniref:hypothetical protein n=1 Tax=Robiginitalea sp. TaxID=1902411 RepID=UPI003C763C9E
MNTEFNAQESLRIIDRMIAEARYRPSKAESTITMLWGYLVMFAALTHWALDAFISSKYAPLAWLLMIPGIIATIAMGFKLQKQRRVRTYVHDLSGQVWLTFTVVFVILYVFMQPTAPEFLPVVMLLYGICMWLQGALIRFNPYKWGAVCCWAGGAVAFLLTVQNQLLVLALVVVLSYIIPGHMLSAKTSRDYD